MSDFTGVPNRIRTGVAAVKGQIDDVEAVLRYPPLSTNAQFF
jgi:hypothetical protein